MAVIRDLSSPTCDASQSIIDETLKLATILVNSQPVDSDDLPEMKTFVAQIQQGSVLLSRALGGVTPVPDRLRYHIDTIIQDSSKYLSVIAAELQNWQDDNMSDSSIPSVAVPLSHMSISLEVIASLLNAAAKIVFGLCQGRLWLASEWKDEVRGLLDDAQMAFRMYHPHADQLPASYAAADYVGIKTLSAHIPSLSSFLWMDAGRMASASPIGAPWIQSSKQTALHASYSSSSSADAASRAMAISPSLQTFVLHQQTSMPSWDTPRSMSRAMSISSQDGLSSAGLANAPALPRAFHMTPSWQY